MKLIPVKYHKKEYPESILPLMEEVAGNFESKHVNMSRPYSLHTEYSYMPRKLESDLLFGLDEIRKANRNGIPQLWKNAEWGGQFAIFLERLTEGSVTPEVIEIHPPFRDYCPSVEKFWESYTAFYELAATKFPNAVVVLENRCGTMYRGASFLFSTCQDMLELCRFLCAGHRELGVVLDYPQLFSAERIPMEHVQLEKILSFNRNLAPLTDAVCGIHLWGKRKSSNGRWVPHVGNLDTFFSGDAELKSRFLRSLKETFSDEKARFFVPEVNSSEDDLQRIVRDMLEEGIQFQQNDQIPPQNMRPQQYLIAVDWENGFPEFVLGNAVGNHIDRICAVGSFSIRVGSEKYCTGNKDVLSGKYIGCPHHATVDGRSRLCQQCQSDDRLKFCVRCSGQRCDVRNPETLTRCHQEHFVYLAYFPGGVVKVGVAHGQRKYARLLEQGALYAYFIAACESGKLAREYESYIRTLGIRDKITVSYKIEHLGAVNADVAEEALSHAVSLLQESIKLRNFNGIRAIEPPERFVQEENLKILSELSKEGSRQLSFWDTEQCDDFIPDSIEILDRLDNFSGEIIAFVGTIAILKQGTTYNRYDFRQLYGRPFILSVNP